MEASFRAIRYERHHVGFNKSAWIATRALRAIREDPRVIVPLHPDTHLELHQSVSHVPPLHYHTAGRALRNFSEYDNDTYLHNVENLQFSIEEAVRHPKADRLERDIAELAIYALELQKPFIDESLPTRLLRA